MKYQLLTIFSLLFICASCQKKAQSPGDNNGGTPTPTPGTALKVTVTTMGGQVGNADAVDGNGGSASFLNPYKLCFDPRNNLVYVADKNYIRVIDAQNNVSTLLGNGILSNWDEILDIDVAPGAAGSLYFTTKYDALYRIDGATNTLTALTEGEGNGDGPLNTNDHLQGAYGIAPAANGDIALYNTYWTALKRVKLSGTTTGSVEAWAGKPTGKALDPGWPFSDGQGTNATFSTHVYDICSDGQGNIYLPDKDNARIRKISPSGMVSSILPYVDADGDYLIAKIKADGVACVTASADGSYVYFTAPIGSYGNSSPLIRLYRPGKGVVSIAGHHDGAADGSGDDAAFGDITGLSVSPDGKTLFVAEDFNKIVRKITVQ